MENIKALQLTELSRTESIAIEGGIGDQGIILLLVAAGAAVGAAVVTLVRRRRNG